MPRRPRLAAFAVSFTLIIPTLILSHYLLRAGETGWLLYRLMLAVLLIIFTLSIIPILTGRERRRARLRQGLCPNCGYDLRASPTQCPECGAPAPPTR